MLKHLTVQDFALVASLEIEVERGLTVITGESGAGKSILLAALSLVLGERASSDLVRPGAKRADVTAEFDVHNLPHIQAVLGHHSVEADDEPGLCLARRTVTADGRSRAYVNGTPVTLDVLRQITGELVDIHGQHANQRLMDRSVQLALLDDYLGLQKPAAEIRELYQQLADKKAHAEQLKLLLDRDADRATLLRYQLDELAELGLQEGEHEKLTVEHKRLSQVDEYLANVSRALSNVEDLDALRSATRALEDIDDEHPQLRNAQQTLTSALDLLDDAEKELRAYGEALEPDPQRLGELSERLSAIHQLARKHQTPEPALVEHTAALAAELDGMQADTSALTALNEEIAAIEARFLDLAGKLSRKRRKGAAKFARTVSATAHQLALPKAKVEVEFFDAVGESGLDRCELQVTTNPKYPSGPLAKIASGGELARLSLAIQITAARTSQLPSLVLDEADVGVGGTTADTIGRLLRELGETTQVLCVTHAPQVAALGDQHLIVRKSSSQDTEIEPLDEATREQELARMLAGANVTDKALEYAKTLLAEA